MRLLRTLVLFAPVWLFVTAATSAPTPTPSPSAPPAQSSPAASPSPSPPPPPSPSPIPVNAFLSLDVTQGPPDQVINVTGGQFNPNEEMTLYWDTTSHVAGSATADGGGNFNSRVKPHAGDAPGIHKLCASVPPNPCANFTIVAATPTPPPTPTPTEAPSPTPTAEQTPILVATPARITANNISGFDVITKPPFVFLPIFGLGALLLSFGYWGVTAMRRPRQLSPLPSAAVVHRATRPDYSAGFGTPPASPSPPPPHASAWDEPMRTVPLAPGTPPDTPAPTAAEQPPEQSVEWGPPVEWGTGGGGDWGFPEPPPADDAGTAEPRD